MYGLEEISCDKWWLSAPTGRAIDMSLSFKMTISREFFDPALFKASNAMPALIDPSPITLMTLFFLYSRSRPAAMPAAAEMDVELCPAPNGSYSLSDRFVKPDRPFA